MGPLTKARTYQMGKFIAELWSPGGETAVNRLVNLADKETKIKAIQGRQKGGGGIDCSQSVGHMRQGSPI